MAKEETQDSAAESAAASLLAAKRSAPQHAVKVLVIGGDRADSELVATTLERAGFTVVTSPHEPSDADEPVVHIRQLADPALDAVAETSADSLSEISADSLSQMWQRAGNIHINPAARSVLVNGLPVSLTAREYDLLYYFAQNAGRVISRAEVFHAVWPDKRERNTNVIEVSICHLRDKIGDCDRRIIKTVRGKGYFFTAHSVLATTRRRQVLQ